MTIRRRTFLVSSLLLLGSGCDDAKVDEIKTATGLGKSKTLDAVGTTPEVVARPEVLPEHTKLLQEWADGAVMKIDTGEFPDVGPEDLGQTQFRKWRYTGINGLKFSAAAKRERNIVTENATIEFLAYGRQSPLCRSLDHARASHVDQASPVFELKILLNLVFGQDDWEVATRNWNYSTRNGYQEMIPEMSHYRFCNWLFDLTDG